MATGGKFDPNKAQNHQDARFAVKAVEHAQTYWNLLEKVQPRELKLTAYDDEIFEHAKRDFPELFADGHEKLIRIDEDWTKSKEGKERWRNYMAEYEKKIKDYNFGSLIRTDSEKEYSEKNTIFVMRMQFYVYEIARNRLGLNDKAHEFAAEEARKEAEEKAKRKAAKKAVS
ncbi:polysaccharide biosynthesis-domain-containing protein [Vararia minispora EC-137]|uniref:Polysaccharide biosynthesis-domain-containing protein n=1 Tax=Vararia minispora EC-137 TaxID=1314806 RepID=A0ACB8QNN5_9AGAM|nr:polysaccharide biosynthesis-domain-containing protein [Vararia minispora EC-137]